MTESFFWRLASVDVSPAQIISSLLMLMICQREATLLCWETEPPHKEAKITKSRSVKHGNLNQVSPKVSAGNYPGARILYVLGSSACNATRSPRRMKCVMVPIFRSKSNRIENSVSRSPGSDKVLVLKSKPPRWFEQCQRWCLYFKGRVTVASVNNFQLVASPAKGPSGEEHEKIILQFGKVGKDLLTMDYQYASAALKPKFFSKINNTMCVHLAEPC